MARGKFITFEGGEGCGKTTQLARLASRLESEGIEVVSVREPGGTALCERLRYLLKDYREDAPCDKSELLLFLAARAQLVKEVIEPSLNSGKWVLSDRFSDSTIAYQGYGRNLDMDFLLSANDFATGAAPAPAASQSNPYEDLEKLAALKAQGVLTDEEFAKMKAECLARIK